MQWDALLNTRRLSAKSNVRTASGDHRQDYARDWDRIIFSTAFRRLHDKTQVFPLPDDDVVHSRLTHSLEVASVGRSLGTRVAALLTQYQLPERELGDVVSAACLAHDIGNPPFGHAGEDAIRRFFQEGAISGLTARERLDLECYEGNAQGFRVLARLQFEDYGGMRLTAATLGAFMKYPRESGADFDTQLTAAKKYGVFQSELALLSDLATSLGLPAYRTAQGGHAWRRHPLAYLVEAADDICNSILDLEDACRLGWVSHEEFDAELRAVVGGKVSQAQYDKYRSPRDRTGYLRALSIGVLVTECSQQFARRVADLLQGENIVPLVELTSHWPVLARLKRMAAQKCYNHPKVLERESAGYAALTGLLRQFVPAALGEDHPRGSLESRMLQFLNQRSDLGLASSKPYDRILRVLDYLSGMTDSYAISSYRRLSGMQT